MATMEKLLITSQAYKNKLIIVVITLAYLSCSSGQLIHQKKNRIDGNIDTDFQPDSSINNLLALHNYTSVVRFIGTDTLTPIETHSREVPVLGFKNKSSSQFLLAYQHYGSARNNYSAFEVGRMDLVDFDTSIKLLRTQYQEFRTESGISLGMTLEQLIKIKGNSFKRIEDSNGEYSINYLLDAENQYVKSHNMPEYFYRIQFDSNDRATNLIYGFSYP